MLRFRLEMLRILIPAHTKNRCYLTLGCVKQCLKSLNVYFSS